MGGKVGLNMCGGRSRQSPCSLEKEEEELFVRLFLSYFYKHNALKQSCKMKAQAPHQATDLF